MTTEVTERGRQKQPILPFKTLDGLAVSKEAPAHIPSLVEGLLLEVGVSMVVAKPKTGKSSLLRTLAVAIAEGRPFLGFDIPSGGDILFLNLEGPRGVVGQHFRKLGLTDHGKIHLVDERMPAKGELGLARLEATIQQHMPLKLVIIDPASKILRLLDSYDPGQVGLAIEELENLAKKYKLHVLFSSHAKKRVTDDPGDASMGSTSFRGGTDTNIFIVKERQNRIISAEQRWGTEMGRTLLLQDETGASILGSTVESIQESQTERRSEATRKRIRADVHATLLFSGPAGMKKRELLHTVDGNAELIADVVREMVSAGEILETQQGKSLLYTIPAIPSEAPPVDKPTAQIGEAA